MSVKDICQFLSVPNEISEEPAFIDIISETMLTTFSYDHMYRILSVNQAYNGGPTATATKVASYTYLNRTDKITVTTGSGQYIDYTYDATGQILRKREYNSSTLQVTTDYIDGFVYITQSGTTSLAYFPMPEGRVRNNSGTLTQEFIITDQQGNARISFQNNGSGAAVVRQENSYYGFGLIMPNSPVGSLSDDNKQLYNGGSEWQNDYGNLPDYYQTYYRNYDAAIARWVGTDPMADYTPSKTAYNYAGNNPIMYNDPLGNLLDPHKTGLNTENPSNVSYQGTEPMQFSGSCAFGDSGDDG
jgi:RHS repeat-associated protein